MMILIIYQMSGKIGTKIKICKEKQIQDGFRVPVQFKNKKFKK